MSAVDICNYKESSTDFKWSQILHLQVCSEAGSFSRCTMTLSSLRHLSKLIKVLHVMIHHPLSPLEVINWLRHGKGIKGILLVVGELLLVPALLAGCDALVQSVLLLQRPVDETQVPQLLAAYLEAMKVISGNH